MKELEINDTELMYTEIKDSSNKKNSSENINKNNKNNKNKLTPTFSYQINMSNDIYKNEFNEGINLDEYEQKNKSFDIYTNKPYYLNPELFEVFQSNSNSSKKVKSIITILSIWNTMMGSGIISFPYSVYNAGIIPSIFLFIIYGLIGFYTCYIVIKIGIKDNDFCDTVYKYFSIFGGNFGKFGKYLNVIFSLSTNIGFCFVYFIIINQNLFLCINELLKILGISSSDDLTPSFSHFSLIYCGIIILIILFPLLILKDISVLIKINSFGIYSLILLLIFIIYRGIYSFKITIFKFDYIKNKENSQIRYIKLLGENPSLLAGTISLGLLSHSLILPLIQNNKNQKNNTRDLFISFCLVIITYIIIGYFGYFGFSASDMPIIFKDNWFTMFPSNNIFMIILRIINIMQLLSVFPVFVYVIRIQFFGIFFNNNFPSYVHIVFFTIIFAFFCCVILYFLYNKLGTFMGFLGAFNGLFLMFIIPIIINMIYYNREKRKNFEEISMVEKIEKIDSNVKEYYKYNEKKNSKVKEKFFYLGQILIILFGIYTLFCQFVKINYFDVHLKD